MGLLKRAYFPEDEEDLKTSTEELYLRLFPKIGRDFVSREDLIHILNELLNIIDPDGSINLDLHFNSDSVKRASVYKDYISSGLQPESNRDLINLSED